MVIASSTSTTNCHGHVASYQIFASRPLSRYLSAHVASLAMLCPVQSIRVEIVLGDQGDNLVTYVAPSACCMWVSQSNSEKKTDKKKRLQRVLAQ
jgi:hypothetical protein